MSVKKFVKIIIAINLKLPRVREISSNILRKNIMLFHYCYVCIIFSSEIKCFVSELWVMYCHDTSPRANGILNWIHLRRSTWHHCIFIPFFTSPAVSMTPQLFHKIPVTWPALILLTLQKREAASTFFPFISSLIDLLLLTHVFSQFLFCLIQTNMLWCRVS